MRNTTRTMFAVSTISLALLVTGCASPDIARKPIADFADATTKAATAFTALNKTGTDALNAYNFDLTITSGQIPKSTGCTIKADRCTPLITDSGQQIPLVSPSLLPVAVEFMGAAQDYAKALDALEQADSTKAVNEALTNVTSAVTAIATAVDAPAGAAAAILSKPLVSAGSFGFGLYQDSLKLDALQRATEAAEGVFAQAIPVLQKEADHADRAYISQLVTAYDTAHTAFRNSRSKSDLEAEIHAADALDRALKAKSAKMFDAFMAAHSELARVLKNPKTDTTKLIAAIGAFAEQAATVKAAVDQLSP